MKDLTDFNKNYASDFALYKKYRDSTNPYSAYNNQDRALNLPYRYYTTGQLEAQYGRNNHFGTPLYDFSVGWSKSSWAYERQTNMISQYNWASSALMGVGYMANQQGLYSKDPIVRNMAIINTFRQGFNALLETSLMVGNGFRYGSKLSSPPAGDAYADSVKLWRNRLGATASFGFAANAVVGLGGAALSMKAALAKTGPDREYAIAAAALAIANYSVNLVANSLKGLNTVANMQAKPILGKRLGIAGTAFGSLQGAASIAGVLAVLGNPNYTTEQKAWMAADALTQIGGGGAQWFANAWLARNAARGLTSGFGVIAPGIISAIAGLIAQLNPSEISSLVMQSKYADSLEALAKTVAPYGYSGDYLLADLYRDKVRNEAIMYSVNGGLAITGAVVSVLAATSVVGGPAGVVAALVIGGIVAVIEGIKGLVSAGEAINKRNEIGDASSALAYFNAAIEAEKNRMLALPDLQQYLRDLQTSGDYKSIITGIAASISQTALQLAAVTWNAENTRTAGQFLQRTEVGVSVTDSNLAIDMAAGTINTGEGVEGERQLITFINTLLAPGREIMERYDRNLSRARPSSHSSVLLSDSGSYKTLMTLEGLRPPLEAATVKWIIKDGKSSSTIDLGNVVMTVYGNDKMKASVTVDVDAGDGDDIIVAGFGALKVNGGTGNNTVSYQHIKGGITASVNESGVFSVHKNLKGNTVQEESVGNTSISYPPRTEEMQFRRLSTYTYTNDRAVVDTLTNVNHLVGSQADDEIRGNAEGNKLNGYLGHDLIEGGGGNDTIIGGAGMDTLKGDSGNDTFLQQFEQTSAVDKDIIDGGDGVDTVDYSRMESPYTSGVRVDLQQGVATKGVFQKPIENTNPVFKDKPGTARYIRIYKAHATPGFLQALALTGMKVFVGGDDVAGGKLTRVGSDGVSSTVNSHNPKALTDVELGGSGANTYERTGNMAYADGTRPYIEVDLGTEYDIDRIVLWGIDNPQSHSLGLKVFLSTSAFGSRTFDAINTDTTVSGHIMGSIIGDPLHRVSQDDVLRNIESVTGTSMGDTLRGDLNANMLDGGNGDDVIEGRAGDDLLLGRKGRDSMLGGEGDDTLIDEDGDDTLDGGNGNDELTAGVGADSILGGTGDDVVHQGMELQADNIDGGEGNDTVDYSSAGYGSVTVDLEQKWGTKGHSGTGISLIKGDTGRTTGRYIRIYRTNDAESVALGELKAYANGKNVAAGAAVRSGVDVGLLYPGDDAPGISLAKLTDQIVGTSNYAETRVGQFRGGKKPYLEIDLGAVYDLNGLEIWGRYGAETDRRNFRIFVSDTAFGVNTYDQLSASTTVSHDDVDPVRYENINSYARDTLEGIENVIGTQQDDQLYGDSQGNILLGEAGSDTLYGSEGTDLLDGGLGADLVSGGAGDDVIRVWDNDSAGTESGDRIYGDSGVDTVDYSGFKRSASVAGLDINLSLQRTIRNPSDATGADRKDDLYGIENVIATSGNDKVTGDDNANMLRGMDGNDSMVGGAGADVIFGDVGNDTLEGGEGADVLYAGTGSDVARGGAGNDTLVADSDQLGDSFDGGEGVDLLDLRNIVGGSVLVDLASGIAERRINAALPISVGTYGRYLRIYHSDDLNTLRLSGLKVYAEGREISLDRAVVVGADITPQVVSSGVNAIAGGILEAKGQIKPYIDIDLGAVYLIDGLLLNNPAWDSGKADGTQHLGHNLRIFVSTMGFGTQRYAGLSAMTERSDPDTAVSWLSKLDVTKVEPTWWVHDTLSGIENVSGSAGADLIGGNDQANLLAGAEGADLLRGQAGNDTLIGGSGADTVEGGDGDDLIVQELDDGGNNIDGGNGNDTLDYSIAPAHTGGVSVDLANNTATRNRVGATQLASHQGRFIRVYNTGTTALVALASLRVHVDGTVISVTLNAAIDSTGAAYLYADMGSMKNIDALTLLARPNRPANETSNLRVFISAEPFTAFNREDLDADLRVGRVHFTRVPSAASTVSDTIGNIENVTGTQSSDTLNGNDGNNVLIAGQGDDNVNGGGGNDDLQGQAGNDVMDGGAGHDRLAGADGNDTVAGGAGNDLVLQTFARENDSLSGGEDVDTLDYSVSRLYGMGLGVEVDLVAGIAKKYFEGTIVQMRVSETVVARGRYVLIYHTDPAKLALALTGLKVFCTGADVAAGKSAFAGGVGSQRHSARALTSGTVGGKWNGQSGAASNMAYASGAGGYIEVDLGADYDIDSIALWGRSDAEGESNGLRLVVSGTSLAGDTSKTIQTIESDPGAYCVDLEVVESAARSSFQDTISGFEVVVGTALRDRMNGSSAGDTLIGGAGDDTLLGNDGSDVLDGGAGADLIDGGSGNDVLISGGGADTLLGGSGDDVMIVDGRTGEVDGGAGRDTVRFKSLIHGMSLVWDDLDATLWGRQGGTEALIQAPGRYIRIYSADGRAGLALSELALFAKGAKVNPATLTIRVGNDEGYKDSAAALLIKTALFNSLHGGTVSSQGNVAAIEGTNPFIEIELQNETMLDSLALWGVEGMSQASNNLHIFVSSNAYLPTTTYQSLALSTTVRQVRVGELETQAITEIHNRYRRVEVIEGTSLGDKINASTSSASTTRRIAGGGGNDTLQGGQGNDTVWGGDGSDDVKGGRGNDKLYAGTGLDTLNGEEGNDTLFAGSDSNRLLGGDDIDTVSYSFLTGSSGVSVNLATNTATKSSEITIGNVQASGRYLRIYNQNDQSELGLVNIMIYVDGAKVFFARNSREGTATNKPYLELDLESIKQIDGVFMQFLDSSKATTSNLRIFISDTRMSPDLTYAQAHNVADTTVVDYEAKRRDHLTTTTITDTVQAENVLGTSMADNITGDDRDNVLRGAGGDDTLNGGGAADILDGGRGNDQLSGGSGDDIYTFAAGDGRDVITETQGSYDRLSFARDTDFKRLWFSRVNNDLSIRIIGTQDRVSIAGWYDAPNSATADNRIVELISIDSGRNLSSSRVQNLVEAMAAFSPPSSTTLPSNYQAALDSVIAANWV